MTKFWSLLLVFICVFEGTWGHGRLWEPPARNTMWRRGFNTPHDYNDNQLYCGGKGHKCGLCGDEYKPGKVMPSEAGGKFATETIARNYTQGQIIDVSVELTANHMGWFEFRIIANNDWHKSPDLQDMQLLQDTNGQSRIFITADKGFHNFKMQLPQAMTCFQCIIQWKYHAGNTYGTDPDGKHCEGCGPQEEFYGCSDVAISASDEPQPPSSKSTMKVTTPTTTTTQRPTTPTPSPTTTTPAPTTTTPRPTTTTPTPTTTTPRPTTTTPQPTTSTPHPTTTTPQPTTSTPHPTTTTPQPTTSTPRPTTTTPQPTTSTPRPTTTTPQPTTSTPRPTTTTPQPTSPTPRPTTTTPPKTTTKPSLTTTTMMPTTTVKPTDKPTTPASNGSQGKHKKKCVAIGVWHYNLGFDDWCTSNCAHHFCPHNFCKCS